jgi:hypothetical protein
VFALAVLAIPISLMQRYRAGSARRTAREWVATVNLIMICFSTGIFLYVAALTSFLWVPRAFTCSLAGFATGAILGLLGLALTRWELTPEGLYYTPNRWLVLTITLVVTTRLLYGFWRGWQAWGATGSESSWLESVGVAGSMAVGAVVLGYYFSYAIGVRHRLARRIAVGRR